MLTNYKEQCESKVKQYIEDTTGLKLDNLSLNDYEQFLLDYKVKVVHTLSAAYEDSIRAGYDNQGEIYHQQSDFEKAINQHLDKELNDEKNLKLLNETIQKSTYGKYIGKFLLADKSSIFYEHSCQNCNGNGEYRCRSCGGEGEWRCDECGGKGEWRCDECGGKGEIRCDRCGGEHEWRCDKCNGHGEYPCSWCDGTGWRGERKCYKCNGRRVEYCESCGGSNGYFTKKGAGFEKCRKCNPQGFIKCDNYRCRSGVITCPTCRGTTIETCSTCDGKTIVRCSTCEGEGKATKIAQIQIHSTATYTTSYPKNTDEKFKSIIKKYQASEIENIANITRTISQDENKKCVIENYQIQIPFARFNLLFNKQKFTWLIYGKNMQIAEGQSDIAAILADDLNALVEVAKHSSWSDTKILKRSQRAVAQFLSSKINTELIESDIKSGYLDLEENIDEKVEQIQNDNANLKSLSKDYIKNALSSFRKMAGSFVRGVTLRYFALAFLISFISVFIVSYPYNLFCPIVIFPLLIAISTAYKKQSFIKLWGKSLASWADKKNFIIPQYRLYTIIGAVCVYVCAYFVNSFIETQEPTQTPKAQAQSPQNEVVENSQPKAQSTTQQSEKRVFEDSQRANVENKPNLQSEVKSEAKAQNEVKTPASEAKNEAQVQSETTSKMTNEPSQNPAQSSVKPSFDCNKASTTTERLVCSDDELASLDLQLANAYKNARNSADIAGKKKILNEQKIWLKAYNLCNDKDCVKQNLEQRIKDLNQMSGVR